MNFPKSVSLIEAFRFVQVDRLSSSVVCQIGYNCSLIIIRVANVVLRRRILGLLVVVDAIVVGKSKLRSLAS